MYRNNINDKIKPTSIYATKINYCRNQQRENSSIIEEPIDGRLQWRNGYSAVGNGEKKRKMGIMGREKMREK